ncbi:MAG: hypothetical protein EOM34_09265 [Clostridia bacterium]|nr:hypothetical protein [Clostridia bacterium]NCD02085.1 hypothetical protein [Clostridia bacterium]
MRKIRTKRESMAMVPNLLIFSVVWYILLIRNIISEKSIGMSLMFLIAGILPLFMAVQQIRRAVYFRRLHREVMNRPPKRGRIISCNKAFCEVETREAASRKMAEYKLIIQMDDGVSFEPVQIESEPYSWPVYKVLASPEVDVYTDDSGWHHVIDGFHYKKHRSDEGIFKDNPWEDGLGNDNSRIFNVIWAVLLIIFLISILRG